MSRRPALSERTVGTVWRTLRAFLFPFIIVLVVYLLFSGMVAISTADKCNGQLHADKEWNFIPPRWECVSTLPGEN
jgi:hypothetical protein